MDARIRPVPSSTALAGECDGRDMPQSLARVVVHLVFATKGRMRWISRDLRAGLYAAMAARMRQLGCSVIRVGGTDDHVHLLFALARTASVASAVEALKVGSSLWMKRAGRQQFAWQAGYGVFSVGEREVPIVAHYIEDQERHHQRTSFQDELRRLLAQHGIAFDERYLWD